MCIYRLSVRTGLAGLLLLASSVWAAAAEIEAGLPEKTTAVVTINLKQLLHAPVVKQHGLDALRQLCRNTEGIHIILEALAFDPFRDLERLTVASVGMGEKAEGILILRGRFDTARFYLAVKNLVKEHSDRLVLHKDENLKYISIVSTGGHGSIIFGTGVSSSSQKGTMMNVVQTKGCLLDAFGNDCLTLLDKNTLVAATSEKLLKETCKRIADKDTSTLNKPMRRLLSGLDGKQTILFAMRSAGTTTDKSETANSGAKSKRTSASCTVMPVLLMPAPAASGAKSKGASASCTVPGGIATAKAETAASSAKLTGIPTYCPCMGGVPGYKAVTEGMQEGSEARPSASPEELEQLPPPRPLPEEPPAGFFIPPPPPSLPESPAPEVKEASNKPSLWELSGGITVAEDLTLRCVVRTTNADNARQVMKGFDELRLRADGLMMFLAGSNKGYAFLKEIPRSFVAVRQGHILLVEGRLPAETLVKLLGTWSVKSR